MSNKANQVQLEILNRVKAKFPTATVKTGWASSYLQNVEQWPLITIGPVASRATFQSKAIKDDMQFHIQLVEHDNDEPETLADRLNIYLVNLRTALFAQKSEDRFNNWHGMLSAQPTEDSETSYIEPSPGQPWAGLSLILTTTYSEKLE
ncbi:hypothetical protein [Rheinheimera sp. MMS21-TC3]|uniref:hypothetical protein n=1 Tax=Rheinheimera sp. MMS21-TC3 TaxID=3072790 RepID=UPI0028C406E0|nr:hypothetical protein [Rheinheimera sp. MMS21-TC3]WNO60888.1 hypothetical protein RDV63_07965 [Rheinheimera sp. MMS21-TC3]